jgi:phosphoglucomutase
MPLTRARAAPLQTYDFLGSLCRRPAHVVDLDAIRDAGVRIGADPLGGASVDYWGAIAERHGLDLTVSTRSSTRRGAS